MRLRWLHLTLFLILGLCPAMGHAKLTVITTTTDLRALVREVGGALVDVESIAKGTQDPHFIEAKPSFMAKVNRADLLLAVGMDLEVGWLPNVIQGARNPKIKPGSSGYLEVGPLVNPLDVPKGNITRAEGDVHPYGNPHVTLDPIRVGEIAVKVAERLAELDSSNKDRYFTQASEMKRRLEDKSKDWHKRIGASGVKSIVTYHKTLSYFFDRFQISNPIILEPKPGIPPTSAHIIEVISTIKRDKVPLVLVENFFDATVTKKIKSEVPSLRVATVPVSVDGAPPIKTLDDLYENLVKAIEAKN